jgi:sensor histidine kinase YesM
MFLAFSNLVFNYDSSKSFSANYWAGFKLFLFLTLIADVCFCYFLIYFLVSKYFLQKKYVAFAISFLLSVSITSVIGIWYAYGALGAANLDKNGQFTFLWGMIISALFVGPMANWAIFLAIKMFKSWYQKQQEKVTLIKANADAEIQLLKAQIHPHFLFNTLNNIYSFTLTKSPLASVIVSHLNDTLSYMIKDCSAEFVPLSKETKLIRDYISLEQIRYGNRLDIQTEIIGDTDGKKISPLLLIPFVENSFKHGTSKMLEHPWMKLLIEIKNSELWFMLSNSKPSADEYYNRKKGIGLQNVKKRLALLYPQAHSLVIESSDDTFIVKMKTPLSFDNIKAVDVTEETPHSLTSNFSYAEQ